MKCISKSFYINNIVDFKTDSTFKPISAFCAFYSGVSRTAAAGDMNSTYMLARLESVLSCVQGISVPEKTGELLEVCFQESMLLRIHALLASEGRDVKLREFLSLPPALFTRAFFSFGNKICLANIMASNVRQGSFSGEEIVTEDALPSFRKTKGKFFEYFERYMGSTGMTGGFWKAAKGDPFDFLMMVLVEGHSAPLVLFLDMKSPLVSSQPFESLAQARAVEDGLRDVTLGPNCAQLFNIENMLFMYITDYNGETEFVNIGRAGVEQYLLKTIVMKSTQTKELLRVVWDVYKSGRNVLGHVQKAKAAPKKVRGRSKV